VTIHCVYHTFLISKELNKAHIIKKSLIKENVKLRIIENNLILTSKGEVSDGIVSDYFKDLIGLKKILDSYKKKTVTFYEFGWFCSDVMLKLGLIGTVIGFIIMLSSLSDITTFDVTLLQGVLTTMGSGMGVALYTTLSALVGGVLIAVQYYNLESGCEELFSVLNQISEISIDNSL
jgi:flagellar motor component MotA